MGGGEEEGGYASGAEAASPLKDEGQAVGGRGGGGRGSGGRGAGKQRAKAAPARKELTAEELALRRQKKEEAKAERARAAAEAAAADASVRVLPPREPVPGASRQLPARVRRQPSWFVGKQESDSEMEVEATLGGAQGSAVLLLRKMSLLSKMSLRWI